jgi:hypothetical protein
MSSAQPTLLRLAIETWKWVALPASCSRPSRHASSCAFVISVMISANFACTSWNDAIGLSNCTRDFA